DEAERVETHDQVGFAEPDLVRDVRLLDPLVDMNGREDRAAFLSKAGLVERVNLLPFDHRRVREQLGDGDDAGSTDAGEVHVVAVARANAAGRLLDRRGL